MNAAVDAGRWVRAAAVETEHGKSWPADPEDDKSVFPNLYHGTAGVVLFFLDLYAHTGDSLYLDDARTGADYLLNTLTGEQQTGLYTGVAGVGFALEETFKVTGDPKYREGVQRCTQILAESAEKAGKGVEWKGGTDIVGGSAGTGLFLLYAAHELDDASLKDLAVAAGHRLVELGRPAEDGLKWFVRPDYPRNMPNFSHGTAGIAYFLATLYGETKEPEFLEAALAGATYLQSIARTDGNICLLFHHEPGGEDLYYLGWCHGPAGTARLFYRLYQVTNDPVWMSWVKRSARAVMESGIPEQQTAGFWNNVSQCCGSAGVAEFFLNLYQATGEEAYLRFAQRVADNLLSRATRDENGIKWVQAEHRVRPDFLVAQTGYMQGAAGIGMLLLHLDAAEAGRRKGIRLPDSPF